MDEQREKTRKKIITPLQARSKAEAYCAYQERSQQEVRDKLYSYGLHRAEVEAIIADLITDNYLNEERFALAYASGKFRMKGWGRYKIKLGLVQKAVSPPLIKLALSSLDDEAYTRKLKEILEARARATKENDPYKRKYKLLQYALGRGFERELIMDILEANDL
jgi:Uncharacterized protein conserved in bacteria